MGFRAALRLNDSKHDYVFDIETLLAARSGTPVRARSVPMHDDPMRPTSRPLRRPPGLALAPQPRRLMPAAGDIFGVAAVILVDALRRQFQHPVRQRGQEVAVMRDEQHRALILR